MSHSNYWPSFILSSPNFYIYYFYFLICLLPLNPFNPWFLQLPVLREIPSVIHDVLPTAGQSASPIF